MSLSVINSRGQPFSQNHLSKKMIMNSLAVMFMLQEAIWISALSLSVMVMVSVQSPRGEIHNLRLSSGGVSSKGLSFSLCRGLPMRSCLENLLASH